MPEYYEFAGLESFAEWIGYAHPEEIHEVASAEGFYGVDCCGDSYLSRDSISDFLRRCGIPFRCTYAGRLIVVEHI